MENLDVGKGGLDRRERGPRQVGVLARPRRMPDDLAVRQVDQQSDVSPAAADAHVGEVAAHVGAARARRTAWPPHWAGRLRWTCRDGIWASCVHTRWPSRFPSLSCRFACDRPLCRGGRARPSSCARRTARGSPRARPARRARRGPAASGIPRAGASSSRPSARRRASRIAPIPGSGRRSPPSPSLSCEYQRRLF